MIYELAYVLRTEANDEAIGKVAEMVKSTVKSFNGEVLIEDAWGVKSFAQPTARNVRKGNYFYVLYKADTQVNAELERRLKISEDVLKFLFVKLGDDADQETFVKAYKNPNHSNQVNTEEGGLDPEKERKMFQKRKSCYFSAKKTSPDWKDPSSYAWLVNEFGKISPARVTGLRPKFQRMATTAIKRGRCLGLISYMSNHTAR